MVARHAGGNVTISEINENRLKFAAGLGFAAMNPRDADVAKAIHAASGGKGADVVFEVSGSQPGVDLSGKTAVVTGARRGIGRGMAKALAEAGTNIIGVSAAMEPDVSDVGDAITALGRGSHGYACDFSNRAAAKAFTAQVLKDDPKIDIPINNAGTIKRKPSASLPHPLNPVPSAPVHSGGSARWARC